MLVRNNLTGTDLACCGEAGAQPESSFFWVQIGEKAEFLSKSAQKR